MRPVMWSDAGVVRRRFGMIHARENLDDEGLGIRMAMAEQGDAEPGFGIGHRAVLDALGVPALRGVRVDIILPGRSNLRYMDWASRALWWQVLERGCRIWLTPPPFDHSKLMLVDSCWALLGSANWDSRSLRLNFEYNLECYDVDLAKRLERLIQDKLKPKQEQVLREYLDSRNSLDDATVLHAIRLVMSTPEYQLT